MNLRNKLAFFIALNSYVELITRGTSPLSLPKAIANSLSYVKAFGGTEQRNLPDDYIERQFIYMMDGSYLTTDVVPTYDCKIEMDFQTTSVPSGSAYLLGGRTETYGGLFFAKGGAGVCIVDAFGTASDDRYTSNVSLSNNTRYKFTFNNKVASLESGGTTLFTNTSTGTLANGAALIINGLNNNGAGNPGQAGIYVYSFKAWNAQGELVMDLVPAVQRGTVPVVGFYDAVSGTFKTATAGTFAAGGEAVPTPDTPMDIVSNNGVLKVNLLDLNSVDNGHYWTANGVYTATSVARLSNTVPVKQGDVIAVTTKVTGSTLNIRYNFFDTQMNWLSQTVYAQSSGGAHTEYITAQQDGYFNFSGNYSGSGSIVAWDEVVIINQTNPIYTDGTVETIKDSLNNTATAEMLLKVGDYQDVQSIIDGVVTRNVGVKVLDGTEDWTYSEPNTYGIANLTGTITGKVDGNTNELICSHFGPQTSAWSSTSTEGVLNGNNNNQVFFRVLGTRIPSLAAWQQWLAAQYAAGTPVIVVYPLATETTESVAGQTLQVTDGDNVLEITQASLDGLELEAKYKKRK